MLKRIPFLLFVLLSLGLLTLTGGAARAQDSFVMVKGLADVDQLVANAVQKALINASGVVPTSKYFAISNIRDDKDWLFVSVVVLENLREDIGWSLEDSKWFGLVLLKRNESGSWIGASEGTIEFSQLVLKTPDTILDRKAKQLLDPIQRKRSPRQGGYIFPWDAGLSMFYGELGVHNSGYYSMWNVPGWRAIDFVSDGDTLQGHASDKVIAATSGSIVGAICADNTSVAIKVNDLIYAHLLMNGKLYPGSKFNQKDEIGRLRHGWFSDNCGFANQGSGWFHLHMGFPNTEYFQMGNWILNTSSQVWQKGRDFCYANKCWLSSNESSPAIPPTPAPNPQPSTGYDNAQFVADVTIPDGTVIAPGQSFVKTWRMRNTGQTTWRGYILSFISGESMNAPLGVDVPETAPGNTADISMPLIASSSPGSHGGTWQLYNNQGTPFGDVAWVSVQVADSGSNNPNVPAPNPYQPVDPYKPPTQLPAIEVSCFDCPAMVPPGSTYRPTVRVKVNSGAADLSESRGDMLRNTDGQLFEAYPHIGVKGNVNAGQSYDFTFYADNPIHVPAAEGSYSTKWRLWRNGNWLGPELTITFQASNSASGNRPPNAPKLKSPGDWYVMDSNQRPTLVAEANGDPDGDAITQYYFKFESSVKSCNSGWISNASWQPDCIVSEGYIWQVKVRDARGQESGWSEPWHISVKDITPRVTAFTMNWRTPKGDIDFCGTYTGEGVRFDLYSFTDNQWFNIDAGSNTAGYICGNWPQGAYPSGKYKARLFVYIKGGGLYFDDSKDIIVDTPVDQPPNTPVLVNPSNTTGVYVNSQTIQFDWLDGYRANNYRLEVATDANFSNHVLDTTTTDSAYQATIPTDYAQLYWRVTSNGTYG